jgi:transcriptional regulator with XRE-family HTH domain
MTLSRGEIKDHIKKLGYKQKFVAKEIGLAEVTFSLWLSNKTNISKAKVHRLYSFLGLEME